MTIENPVSEIPVNRRDLLRISMAGLGVTGLGLGLAPGIALAAASASVPADDLLPNIRALVERSVGPGRFPGMVVSLGVPGRDPQFVAQGRDGFTDLDEMTPDTLFRIYSMTKLVTGMATMMLIDEGKLALDRPLADILPKYATMQVMAKVDGPLADVKPATRAITIRHLLTHTAGLVYAAGPNTPLKKLLDDKGLISGQISRLKLPTVFQGEPVRSLELFADRLADVPLLAEPGTKWSYGFGLDLLGRVIEVVSGTPFDRFLAERIFTPLGMNSTFFRVPASEKGRLATNFAVVGETLVPIDQGDDSIFLDEPPVPLGGSGLVSSPRDYDKFLRMLANYGVAANGQRVMSESAVRVGTSNLLPEAVVGQPIMGSPGLFGAGGRVGTGTEAGMFGWGGAAGTIAMVDMRNALTSSLFVQFMPPDAKPLHGEFQTALKADVMAYMGRRK